MGKDAIMVVDFGTSNVRASLIDVHNGCILSYASKNYPTISPIDGYAEIETERLWLCSESCVADVIEHMDQHTELHAITFSYFGDNLILVDKDGNPLYNMILAVDNRGVREAEELCSHFGEKNLIDIIGTISIPGHTGCKILWLKKHMPEVYANAAYFYTNQQYINMKLGLEPVNDFTMASRKNIFDINKRKWAQPLLDYIGITAEQLGGVVDSGTLIGKIKRYGSVELPGKIPVVLGAHDCDYGILGLGVYNEHINILADITGTYDHLGYISNEFINAQRIIPGSGIITNCGPLTNTVVCICNFPTSGSLVDWFMRQIIGSNDQDAYEKLWSKVVFDSTNTVFMNPNFSLNMGCWQGLGLNTKVEDLFVAVIESLTFEMKYFMDYFIRLKGKDIDRVRIGGGLVRSTKWTQLRSNVFDKKIEVVQNMEVSSLGAAVMAAVSVGLYDNIKTAVSSMVRVTDTFEPDAGMHERYAVKYADYVKKIKI